MANETDLLSRLSLKPGIDTGVVASALSRLGISPPADYVSFMARSNGAQGVIGGAGYLVLWPAERLEAINREYSVAEFAPGYVIIGSDGGDTAYAFGKAHPGVFFQMPFIGMSDKEAQPIGSSFIEFVKSLALAE